MTHDTQPLAIRMKPALPQLEDYREPHGGHHISLVWRGADLPTGLHNVLAGLEQCAVEPHAASILCAKLFEAAPQLMLLAGEIGMVYQLGALDRAYTPAEIATLEALRDTHAVEFVRAQAGLLLRSEAQIAEVDA